MSEYDAAIFHLCPAPILKGLVDGFIFSHTIVNIIMNKEAIEYLKKQASQETWEDVAAKDGDEYVDINEFDCGNIDDAYYGGYSVGQADVARTVLNMLGYGKIPK